MRRDPVRSVLYLPASNARAIDKARTLDCDVAILDLEDAVAPEAKIEARAAAVEAVRAGGFGPRLGVRINALDTEWGEDDLDALAQAGARLIVAPKVETPETVHALSAGAPDAALWAMIETPRAMIDLGRIAQAGGGLDGLMLGVNDLAKGLGTGASPDREPFKPWLAALVAASRACAAPDAARHLLNEWRTARSTLGGRSSPDCRTSASTGVSMSRTRTLGGHMNGRTRAGLAHMSDDAFVTHRNLLTGSRGVPIGHAAPPCRIRLT